MPVPFACRAVFAAFVLMAAAPLAHAQENTITVFAAASMKNALDDINAAFLKATGTKVTASYAASSALAKQLEAGAPVDVFISADRDWMDYAIAHKTIDAASRVDLLGNKLVLVAPKDSKLDNVSIAPGFDIARLAGDGRIAVADVNAVPAGKYAKAVLTALGAWSKAEAKLAQAENVRAALAYVSRGETNVGIVYATDARADARVKIVGTFPDGSYPPVIYPAAATVSGKPAAKRYLQFLRTREAKAIFETYGFSVLPPSS